jgi:hypothetical protein
VGGLGLNGILRRLAASALGACLLAAGAAGAARAAPIGAYTTKGAWNFTSAPKLHPPKLLTDARTVSGKLAAGDFLVANFPNVGAKGPMTGEGGPLILDTKLRPVWFRPGGTGVVSADLQQETFDGQPVLVWWQGLITRTGATKAGQVFVVDQHYHQVATLKAKAPWLISLHDAVISGGDIWVTVYRNVPKQNLTAYGGSRNGTVYDSGVQEYDLRTGKLLYTWDALNPGGTPNVPLSSSEQPAAATTGPGGSWDAYHVNAVQVLPGNQILVSMRNTWAAYLINTLTNQTVWTLGGKHSSFAVASNARFAWQHDVTLVKDDVLMPEDEELTLYDDNCCKELPGGKFAKPNGASRGMILKLNTLTHAASLIATYPRTSKRVAAFLGSMQELPNGNALVGWGSQPFFSEYSRSGQLLLDAKFPGKDQSYRALFSPDWVGTPSYPPSGARRTTHGTSTVYASWNGATEVARWEVLGGASASHLNRVTVKPSAGFETPIIIGKAKYKVLEARALDAQGHVLGTSPAF